VRHLAGEEEALLGWTGQIFPCRSMPRKRTAVSAQRLVGIAVKLRSVRAGSDSGLCRCARRPSGGPLGKPFRRRRVRRPGLARCGLAARLAAFLEARPRLSHPQRRQHECPLNVAGDLVQGARAAVRAVREVLCDLLQKFGPLPEGDRLRQRKKDVLLLL
jgi:hypothetical protein